jgi:hypothetical protein
MQVDLQLVITSIDSWTGSLKDDITDTRKDCQGPQRIQGRTFTKSSASWSRSRRRPQRHWGHHMRVSDAAERSRGPGQELSDLLWNTCGPEGPLRGIAPARRVPQSAKIEDPECRRILARILYNRRTAGLPRLPHANRGPHKGQQAKRPQTGYRNPP